VSDVTVVRIYLNEKENRLDRLLRFLHDEEKVRGVTAFRGIAGFGASGELHTARTLDIALDLPIVVEFFDATDKVARILADLRERVDVNHVISWDARLQ
jgi:PII-like signaling protein